MADGFQETRNQIRLEPVSRGDKRVSVYSCVCCNKICENESAVHRWCSDKAPLLKGTAARQCPKIYFETNRKGLGVGGQDYPILSFSEIDFPVHVILAVFGFLRDF